jgi:uncharacterized protein (TIGR03663 family)
MKPASMEKRRKTRASPSPAAAAKPVSGAVDLSLRVWKWGGASILVAAALLRLIELTVKPLHHDEGVNGLFLTTLFRGGYYRYDPSNFHGPTLYYFAWITTTINSFFFGKDGLSTFAIRLTTVLFGLGIVWLLLCLRRQLGTFGALAAAALACVSSGMVFFSRYFIHEILFVFFTLGVVVAILEFRQTARPRYLMLASLSAALLCATKETWIITVAVWLIALPCTGAYFRLRKMLARPTASMPSPDQKESEVAKDTPGNVSKWSPRQLYAAAALLFVVVWVLFYSSFFTNFPQGVIDSVRTFTYWTKTSGSAHTYGPTQYLNWLGREDLPVLMLGALGIAIALWQGRSRFAVFTAFWSLGILAAYSLVAYKTPWCALNIILPFIIVASYGLEQLYRRHRVWGALVLAVAVGASAYRAIDLSFFHYDDDTRAYVYAHTQRDFLLMVDEIDSIAAGNPAGRNIGIVVMSPEHWPLPWYLRNYPNAGYWGKVIETSEPILVVHETQLPEVERTLGSRYRLISAHDLRPGNRLYLYLRRDVQP